MSQQAPGANQDVSQSADGQEVATLRRAISEITLKEQQLTAQRDQLHQRIAQYEQQAKAARGSDREGAASQAEVFSQRLQTHLPLIQGQLDSLRIQREQLEQHLTLVETQPLPVAPGTGNLANGAAGLVPAGAGKAPSARRRKGRLLVALFVLAVAVIVTPLALLHGRGTSHPATHTPTPTKIYPTPTLTPTPAPIVFTPNGSAPASRDCQANISYACYSPEQMQSAYHLTPLYKQGYDGKGQTIVIIGAGHTTTLKQDLHQFDLAWGLPDPPSFQILQPQGEPVPYDCGPDGDGLTLENTLDVEWSHAIAPGANIILLVWSNGFADAQPQDNCGIIGIDQAVAYALRHQLGQIISISYGGSELGAASETAAQQADDKQFYTQADAIFKQAADNRVTVLAASGDSGATNPDGSSQNGFWKTPNVSWPASDPYVLAVGGTSVQIGETSGARTGEQVWNDGKVGGSTGGGLSAIFPEPDYQKLVPDQSLLQGKRGIPDVAFPAAINFSLYSSSRAGAMGKVNPTKWNHWDLVGGTSASAPCWAGLIALANQMEGSSLGFIQPWLYQLRGQGMNDITTGDNSFGGVTGYQAQVGFDLVSGWGTPIADQLLNALINLANTAPAMCPRSSHQCG